MTRNQVTERVFWFDNEPQIGDVFTDSLGKLRRVISVDAWRDGWLVTTDLAT